MLFCVLFMAISSYKAWLKWHLLQEALWGVPWTSKESLACPA
jgi:hypothetical protein